MKALSVILLSMLICSCGQVKKAGSSLAEGLNTQTKGIAQNLVSGVQTGLSDTLFQTGIYKLLDSSISVAGTSANRSLKKIMDSLLNDRWSTITRQLVEDATGKRTLGNVNALKESLLGVQTQAQLKALVAAVINDQLIGKLVGLKKELIGAQTNKALTEIVDSAILHVTTGFQTGITDSTLLKLSRFIKYDLNSSVSTNLSLVQKYATLFLVGISLVAAFIITLIWFNRQKYLKLSTLLASHVNSIPNQQVYDQVTARIKQSAVNVGVEPALRNILDKNNLLGKETWKPIA